MRMIGILCMMDRSYDHAETVLSWLVAFNKPPVFFQKDTSCLSPDQTYISHAAAADLGSSAFPGDDTVDFILPAIIPADIQRFE